MGQQLSRQADGLMLEVEALVRLIDGDARGDGPRTAPGLRTPPLLR